MGPRIEAVKDTFKYVASELSRGSDLPRSSQQIASRDLALKNDFLGMENAKIAEKQLRKVGIWDEIQEVVKAIPSTRNAVVDTGLIEENYGKIKAVAVIFWAPQISIEGKVTSKAVRLVNGDWGMPRIEYAHESEIDAGKIIWKKLEVSGAEASQWTNKEKLELAMLNVSGRIEDNRKRVRGKYVGKPGIGNIK